MKPRNHFLFASSIVLAASSILTGALHAQSSTWTSLTSGGNWGDIANWNNGAGPVADGANNTADFSTLDIPGAFTVNLATNRTIGTLKFGDTETLTTPGTWTLAGTATLNLAGIAPTISTAVNTTINTLVSGTTQVTKSGSAILTLNANNTGLTGGFNVTEGQLTVRSAGGAAGTGMVILNNGTTFRMEKGSSASIFSGNAITVPANATAYMTSDTAASGYFGLASGDASSVLQIGNVGATTQVSFSANASTQQLAGFLGTVRIFDGTSLRFSASSGLVNGGQSATFDTSFTGDITTRNGGTVHLGALTGSGTVTGSGGANGTAVFSIGAKGIDSTFSGVIRDANTGTRFAAVTKVGAAKLTLTGANIYTGATNVNLGTLEIGDGGSLGATNINIAAGATLVANTTGTQVFSNAIGGAGNFIKRGSGQTSLNGNNTFSTNPVIEGGTLVIATDAGLGNAANSVSFTTGSGKLASSVPGLITARPVTIEAGATGGFAALTAADSLQVDSTISGAGGLQIGGNGLVRLTAANSYSGNTNITSGTLTVANTSGSATSTGSVTVSGGNLAGPGTITGPVSIANGAGVKPGAVSIGGSSVGTLTTGATALAGGSTLYTEFTNATTYDKLVVAGALTAPGASLANPILVDLRLENSVAKWTTLGSYNLIQYSGAAPASVNDLFEVAPGSVQSGLTYAFVASGGFITLNITGAAPSEWNVDAAGTWSNAANWLNGVPNGVGATAKFGAIITAPRTVTLDTAKTVGAIQFNNENRYTVSGTPTLTLAVTSGSSSIEVLAGSHTISTPLTLTSPLSLSLASPANTLTLGGNIGGAGSITNPTSGAAILTGTNTFTGGVNFSSGSLTFGTGSLGTGALTLADSTLIWNGGNTQDISNRVITIGGTNVTFNTNGNNVLLANAIGNNGSGRLTKDGQGTLTLAADATFTGAATITDGVLQIGNGGNTGLIDGTIINNATLAVKVADGSFFSNLITGTGSFVHAGAGSLTLTSQNSFSGTTSITQAAASLILADPLNIGNSTLEYSSTGGSLSFGTLGGATFGGLSGSKNLDLTNTTTTPIALTIGANNQATTYTGSLSGGGSLTKIGTGISLLGGANTYTGTTTISGGDLEVELGGSITSGSALTTNGTGRLVVSGGTYVGSTGTLTPNSGGLLLLSGNATFSGPVTANGSNGSNASAPIKVVDGTLNVPSLNLGRTFLITTLEPVAAPVDTNLYISGGTVNISGNLDLGTVTTANSSVVTRLDGGLLSVGGVTTISINNAGRWSMMDIANGEFRSTDTTTGLIIGGPFAGKNAFLIRGGLATVERVQLGQGTSDGISLLNLSGGELDLGAGGVVVGSTGAGFTSEVRLSGGTLGAKAAWSSTVPINVSSSVQSTIRAANSLGASFDITLTGNLTGTGGINKDGGGTVTLSGAHSYTGPTNVMAGTLKVQSKTFDDAAAISIEASSGAKLELDYTGSDTVGSLTINGAPQANGTWGAPGSGAANTSTAFTGTGILNVGVVTSPYASWATAQGLTAGTNDGPNQDPDNDGIKNSLEFALGGNPLSSATAVLPQLAVTATNFVFTFNRADDSESEVPLTFQWSTNLTTWTGNVAVGATSSAADANGVTVDVVENGSAADSVTVTVPRTNAAGGKLFGRLQAVK